MLICDLCGNRNNVKSYVLNFEIKESGKKTVGTMYNTDICNLCYTKIHDMIHVYNNSPTLHNVLAKGLNCENLFTRNFENLD